MTTKKSTKKWKRADYAAKVLTTGRIAEVVANLYRVTRDGPLEFGPVCHVALAFADALTAADATFDRQAFLIACGDLEWLDDKEA